MANPNGHFQLTEAQIQLLKEVLNIVERMERRLDRILAPEQSPSNPTQYSEASSPQTPPPETTKDVHAVDDVHKPEICSESAKVVADFPDLVEDDGELEGVKSDALDDDQLFSFTDNEVLGNDMTMEDLVKNPGPIAQSKTSDFVDSAIFIDTGWIWNPVKRGGMTAAGLGSPKVPETSPNHQTPSHMIDTLSQISVLSDAATDADRDIDTSNLVLDAILKRLPATTLNGFGEASTGSEMMLWKVVPPAKPPYFLPGSVRHNSLRPVSTCLISLTSHIRICGLWWIREERYLLPQDARWHKHIKSGEPVAHHLTKQPSVDSHKLTDVSSTILRKPEIWAVHEMIETNAFQAHEHLAQLGLFSEAFSCHNVMWTCSKLRYAVLVLKLFDEMPNRNVVPWILIFSSTAQYDDFEVAMINFLGMISVGLRRTVFSFGSVNKMCDTLVCDAAFGINCVVVQLQMEATPFVCGRIGSSEQLFFRSMNCLVVGCWNCMFRKGKILPVGHDGHIIRCQRILLSHLPEAFIEIKQPGVVGWGFQGLTHAHKSENSLVKVESDIVVRTEFQKRSRSFNTMCGAGFREETGTLGKLYKNEISTSKSDQAELLKRLWHMTSYGFYTATDIDVCNVFPQFLCGGYKSGDVESWLDGLKLAPLSFNLATFPVESEDPWNDVCRKMKLVYDMGYEKATITYMLSDKNISIDYWEPYKILYDVLDYCEPVPPGENAHQEKNYNWFNKVTGCEEQAGANSRDPPSSILTPWPSQIRMDPNSLASDDMDGAPLNMMKHNHERTHSATAELDIVVVTKVLVVVQQLEVCTFVPLKCYTKAPSTFQRSSRVAKTFNDMQIKLPDAPKFLLCLLPERKNCDIYGPSVQTQYPKVEMIGSLFKLISDTEDDDIIKVLLLDFYTSFGKQKPEQIITFRDDVSESQFPQVLNVELDHIIEVFRSLAKKWNPDFVFVAAQKIHHTNFFQPGVPENAPPGTIIDSKILHLNNNDLSLRAHAGIMEEWLTCLSRKKMKKDSFFAMKLEVIGFGLLLVTFSIYTVSLGWLSGIVDGALQLRCNQEEQFKVLQVVDRPCGNGKPIPSKDIFHSHLASCSVLNIVVYLYRLFGAAKPVHTVHTENRIFGADATDVMKSLDGACALDVAPNILWAVLLGNIIKLLSTNIWLILSTIRFFILEDKDDVKEGVLLQDYAMTVAENCSLEVLCKLFPSRVKSLNGSSYLVKRFKSFNRVKSCMSVKAFSVLLRERSN